MGKNGVVDLKQAAPTKALPRENFETGPAIPKRRALAQRYGNLYRRLSFSSRKTNLTSFLAVKASARLCWN